MARLRRLAPLPGRAALALAAAFCLAPYYHSIGDFHAAKTLDELNAFIGASPRICVPATADTQVCAWTLGNRSKAWHALATMVNNTHDRVKLICQLPRDGSSRSADSCSPFSARGKKLGRSRRLGGGARRYRTDQPTREERQAQIDAAQTVMELSRVVGDAPTRYDDSNPDTRSYTWIVSKRDRGYYVIAGSIASKKRIRFSCELPRGGGPRPDLSCNAVPDY